MTREVAIGTYEAAMMNDTTVTLYGTKEEKLSAAVAIIRYVITDLLEWTPEEALNNLDDVIAKEMRIDKIVQRYVPYPFDLDKSQDYDYLVSLCFPSQVQYDPEDKVIAFYKKIISGEETRFPKNYFAGDNGMYKAGLLLMYIISRHMPIHDNDVAPLYRTFADTKKIRQKFNEWRITDIAKREYNSPLEFLHYSLPYELANDMLYSNYMYRSVREQYAKKKLTKPAM